MPCCLLKLKELYTGIRKDYILYIYRSLEVGNVIVGSRSCVYRVQELYVHKNPSTGCPDPDFLPTSAVSQRFQEFLMWNPLKFIFVLFDKIC